MILNEFGKPAREQDRFIAPDWLMDEWKRASHDWEAERRLRELRNSVAFALCVDASSLVGSTVKIRLPKRFQVQA